MSVVLSSISSSTSSSDVSSDVHIRSIEVAFKTGRAKFPVSIKVEIGEGETYKSRQYEEGEDVHWLFEKQLPRVSGITINIREHHRFRRTVNVMTIPVPLAKLVMKATFVPDGCSDKTISVKIHCGAAGPFSDIIRCLIEQSQAQLKRMKLFLERLRRACELLEYISRITEAASLIHPLARSAAVTATTLFEYCRSLQDCHAMASEVMEDVATFIPFTDFQTKGLKCSATARTTEQMMKLFEKICRTIMKYSSASVLGGFMDERADEIHRLKKKFQCLKETFAWCLTTEIWKTTLTMEKNTESLLLRLLNPVWDAYYSGGRTCFEGSRRDTLRIVEEWSVSVSSPKLMWIYGSPGLGKTAIAHSAAKMFDDENRLAGCFFTSKEDRERQNPKKIFPTIAYQMAKWHGDYYANVLNALRAREELGLFLDLDSQFDILIRRPVTNISTHHPPPHKPLIMILDALDEFCDNPQSRRCLADYVVDFAMLVPWLKVLVCSRKSSGINARFRTAKVKNLGLDDPVFDLRNDIEAYARLCARSKTRRNSAPRPPGFESDVGGLFSRISRSLRMLRATSDPDDFRAKTKLWDIDDFFRALTQSIMDRDGYHKDKFSLVRDIMAISSCLSSIKPPTKDILISFLRPFQPHHTEDDIHTTIFSLSPIISMDSTGTVNILFPAPAFIAFISDQRRAGSLWVDMKSLSRQLGQRCLDVMQEELKRNICNLSPPIPENPTIPDLADRILEHIPSILQYSCLSWMDLVSRSGDPSFRNPVTNFLLSPKAIFWIEVLSLTGAVERGIEILSMCADYFKEYRSVVSIATELRDFISEFKEPITLSAIHVYASALSWLPLQSTLSQGTPFSVRNPPTVLFERHSIPETADTCMNLGIGVTSIARSSNGRVVTGSKDGTLQQWDGCTGVRISAPIKAHTDEVRDVQYSPDSTRIVSGSLNGTVSIWDAGEGRISVGPLQAYRGSWVLALTCSPDGSRVVSGDFTGALRTWNSKTGGLIKEFQSKHEEYVSSLAYSPNGRRIVSGSKDSTVRVWDAQTGAPVGNPFKCNEGCVVRAVGYSPDGKRIVSGYSDAKVRIWDAIAGNQILGPLEGHQGEVIDVRYSPDGAKILSASRDESIRIWHAATGVPIGLIRRGESRWDPGEECFVSIPSWWPRNRLKVESIVYSSNLLEIRSDGWVRQLDGGLLLWVPPDHRGCSCHTSMDNSRSTDSNNERLARSQWKGFLRAADWSKIIDAEKLG